MGKNFTILVDPGPLSTIPILHNELTAKGVKRIDYILLTHIHIDHAGGAGALLKEFPKARVICHPDGIRHMTSPEKLWQGSRKVLGNLAEAYGEIIPIPAEKIGYEETIGQTGIRVFLTPGHAQHHCSYLLDDLLFAGELAGNYYRISDSFFMRPATPPRFILQVALDSIDKMIELAPRTMVFAHYGVTDEAMKYLRIARNQLLLWVKGVAANILLEKSEREKAIADWLLQRDEHYRNASLLPQDIMVRERYFLGNTLRGLIEYVEGLPIEEQQRLVEG